MNKKTQRDIQKIPKIPREGFMSTEKTADMFNNRFDNLIKTIDRLLNLLK